MHEYYAANRDKFRKGMDRFEKCTCAFMENSSTRLSFFRDRECDPKRALRIGIGYPDPVKALRNRWRIRQ